MLRPANEAQVPLRVHADQVRRPRTPSPASFIFNGQRYTVGLPVTSELTWKAYRFGYEWDFVYRDRGFVGLLLEAKYTDISATLTANVLGVTQTSSRDARGPIPAIGIIGRGYIVPNISITGEFSGFPEIGTAGSSRYGGKYYDFDHLRHGELQRSRRRPGGLPLVRRALQGEAGHRAR